MSTMTFARPLLLSLCAAGLCGAAQAATVTLVPGNFTPMGSSTIADEPWLAGVVVAERTDPFTMTGGLITGTIHSRVVRSALDHTLDFYWQVAVDATAPPQSFVTQLRLGDFVTGTYRAGWAADGSGDVPVKYGYLFAGLPGSVNFGFEGDGVGAGQASRWIYLDTAAFAYAPTARMDAFNGGMSEVLTTFAPAVPEPSTYALMALGLAGLAALRHRRSAR